MGAKVVRLKKGMICCYNRPGAYASFMPCSSCPASKQQNPQQNARQNPSTLIQLVPGDSKKPDWLKVKAKLPNEKYIKLRRMAQQLKLATVCEEAMCPNIGECWGGGTATFMLMGNTCTRACRFCNVNHGKPQPLNSDEPKNLAEAIGKMGVDYAVITCVDRDDLPDGGACHFAQCIQHLRTTYPKVLVEVLTSDFCGKQEDVKKVIDAQPHVYGHNVETVRRLQNYARDHRANYEQSLSVLEYVKSVAPQMYTKSSIMVGLGEKSEEVVETMQDLRKINVDFLTIGQYLRPTAWNLKVTEYVPPEQFELYRVKGLELGFKYVASGPYVRSSYKAGELFILGETKVSPT